MRLVILVPRRADGGWRDRLWSYCRPIWEQAGFEVFEGHDNSSLPFNHSAAINVAAKAAGDWDAAFMCDSDLVEVPASNVVRAAELAVAGGHLVYPHDRYLALREDATKDIIDNGIPPDRWNRTSVEFRFYVRHGYARACPVIPRTLWDELCGMDERFIGWGPEDHAMNAAATTLGGPHAILDGGHLYHLWHPTRKPDESDPDYAEACRLFRRYQDADGDPVAMRALLAERRPDAR